MNPKKFRGLCLNGCGNEIKRGATKYCSIRCQHLYHFSSRSEMLRRGEYVTLTSTRFIKRFLIEQRGERCERCGWSERHGITGRVPIEVEHIDGNWQNNLPENLQLLCPNCHSLTPTYRALNRGRGRPFRLGGRGDNEYEPPQSPAIALRKSRVGAQDVESGLSLFSIADVAERLNARDL